MSYVPNNSKNTINGLGALGAMSSAQRTAWDKLVTMITYGEDYIQRFSPALYYIIDNPGAPNARRANIDVRFLQNIAQHRQFKPNPKNNLNWHTLTNLKPIISNCRQLPALNLDKLGFLLEGMKVGKKCHNYIKVRGGNSVQDLWMSSAANHPDVPLFSVYFQNAIDHGDYWNESQWEVIYEGTDKTSEIDNTSFGPMWILKPKMKSYLGMGTKESWKDIDYLIIFPNAMITNPAGNGTQNLVFKAYNKQPADYYCCPETSDGSGTDTPDTGNPTGGGGSYDPNDPCPCDCYETVRPKTVYLHKNPRYGGEPVNIPVKKLVCNPTQNKSEYDWDCDTELDKIRKGLPNMQGSVRGLSSGYRSLGDFSPTHYDPQSSNPVSNAPGEVLPLPTEPPVQFGVDNYNVPVIPVTTTSEFNPDDPLVVAYGTNKNVPYNPGNPSNPTDPVVPTGTDDGCPCDCEYQIVNEVWYLTEKNVPNSLPLTVEEKTVVCDVPESQMEFEPDCEEILAALQRMGITTVNGLAGCKSRKGFSGLGNAGTNPKNPPTASETYNPPMPAENPFKNNWWLYLLAGAGGAIFLSSLLTGGDKKGRK